MSLTKPLLDKKLEGVTKQIEEIFLLGEDDWVPPTEYSRSNAGKLVAAAYTLIRLEDPHRYELIPEPILTTDDQGGIRITWRSNGREIRANFGGQPDLRTYLYHESGSQYGIEDLNDRSLSDRLRWIVAR
jgi:hypothetical protein